MQAITDKTELENQAQFNFINSLKSQATKQSYQTNIKLYMKYRNMVKFSDLLAIKEPDEQIINYIMHLREKNLSEIK